MDWTGNSDILGKTGNTDYLTYSSNSTSDLGNNWFNHAFSLNYFRELRYDNRYANTKKYLKDTYINISHSDKYN